MRLKPILRRGLMTLSASAILLGSGCAGPEPHDQARANPPAERQPAAPAGEQPAAPAPAAPQSPPPDQPGQAPGGNGVLDELAGELELRDQESRALAQHYFRTGMRYYEAFDYRKAAESFQKAHDADGNDPEIRHYLLQAQLLAGDRIAEFETISELLRQQRDVSIELEKAELKRLYQEGETLLEKQEFARAITRFEQVLEKIRWFPYKVDAEGFEDSAKRYIVQARRSERERDLQEAEGRERRAHENAVAEQERYRLERREQVEQLLRKTLDQLALHHYDQAERTIEEVLEKDPGNDEALKLRELATEHRHQQAQGDTYYRNRAENVLEREGMNDVEVTYFPQGGTVIFPDKEHWAKVRQRHVGISTAQEREPDWIRDYRQVLKSRKVTLNFPDTPFAEVISFLQDITGLNITVSTAVDQEEVTVSLRLREIPLEDALKIILEQTQLAMTFKNETLMITPPEEARGEYDLEIYDVQDLLSRIPDFPGDRIRIASDGGGGGGGGGGAGSFSFDTEEESDGSVLDPDQLETIVTNSVGEDNWDDPASIEIHKGQIIVNQTRELHGQIRDVLKNLRRNTGLFVQVETRFINMTDDFMRDVGVDFRDLGVSPNPSFGQTMVLDPTQTNPQQRLIGFGRQIPSGGNAQARSLGPNVPIGGGQQAPLFGSSMFGGITQNILDGGNAFFGGSRLNSAGVVAQNPNKGLALQATILDPFQLNAIIRMEEENARRKIVQAPVITAANRQRVHVSVITQRAYISDYELSSGGTGLVVAEVADPIIETFQEGVVLDVRPTISADRKYITLDVRPTLATLVGGSFRQIAVNLGTISSAAINVNIEVPQIVLQEAFTSVTLPDGGTALLGGFRQITNKEEHSGVPFVDRIPLVSRLFSRDGELNETANLIILVTAKMVSLRDEEAKRYNVDQD